MSSERSSTQINFAEIQSPFFIHPADLTRQPLIPFKLVGAENYRKWRRAVEKAFSSKLKLGFIRGAIERNEENREMWDRCNDLCCSWILGIVSSEVYDSIFELDTVFEMWKDLEECYSRHTGPSKYQVLKEIHSFQQGSKTIPEYYTKMKSLWLKLASMKISRKCEYENCTCDVLHNIEKEEEEEKLMVFLMGLNDSYTIFKGNLLLMNPLPSIAQAYHLVSQAEDQRKTKQSEMGDSMTQYTALVARQSEEKGALKGNSK